MHEEAKVGTRDRILDAARTVFGARGYRAGALDDVAKAAQISRSGLLHHFPNKEALLVALIERRNVELTRDRRDRSDDMSVFTLIEGLANAIASRPLDRDLVLLAHILTAEASGADHPARK